MRRKRRIRVKRWSEGIKIPLLPNILTSASLFGGFYSIICSMSGKFEAASIAIILSGILDAIDGRVARLTNKTSHFGLEYDSLSDLVAFGVAPAILIFKYSLQPFGRLGWIVTFIYLICGALRLARFNVEVRSFKSKEFNGLPIPIAATFFCSMVLFSNGTGLRLEERPLLIFFLALSMSYLMVSNVKYQSFKEINIRKAGAFHVFLYIILFLILIAYRPRIMIFSIVFLYVLSGPFSLLILKRRRVSDEKGGMDTEPQTPTNP